MLGMMAKRKKVESMSDQLRRLIRTSDESCYAIAKATGVSNAALSRFLSGERGLSARALDALGSHLGWTVIAKPVRKGK